jgi:hypothetical protein
LLLHIWTTVWLFFLFLWQIWREVPVRLPWKADDYARQLPARPNGFDSFTEKRLSDQFPPLSARPFPKVTLASTLVDAEGVILAWFLPGAFSASRQVSHPNYITGQQCCNLRIRFLFGKLYNGYNHCSMEECLMGVGECTMIFSRPPINARLPPQDLSISLPHGLSKHEPYVSSFSGIRIL